MARQKGMHRVRGYPLSESRLRLLKQTPMNREINKEGLCPLTGKSATLDECRRLFHEYDIGTPTEPCNAHEGCVPSYFEKI